VIDDQTSTGPFPTESLNPSCSCTTKAASMVPDDKLTRVPAPAHDQYIE
jgi:hypothetical protein